MELLAIPALVGILGLIVAALLALAIAALRGWSAGRAYQWSCLAIGAGGLITGWILIVQHEEPDISVLQAYEEPFVLEPNADIAARFEIRKATHYEVLLRFDPSFRLGDHKDALGCDESWPARVGAVATSWRVSSGGSEVAEGSDRVRLLIDDHRRDEATDLLSLGYFRAAERGTYDLALRVERLPAVLADRRAHLVVDGGLGAYKNLWVRANVDAIIRGLFMLNGGVALFVGLVLALLRWKPTYTGPAREASACDEPSRYGAA